MGTCPFVHLRFEKYIEWFNRWSESHLNMSILLCVALTCQDDCVFSLTRPNDGLQGRWGAQAINFNTSKL